MIETARNAAISNAYRNAHAARGAAFREFWNWMTHR
jgi:hypothetical protein